MVKKSNFRSNRSRQHQQRIKECFFCVSKSEPDLKEAETLRRFTSERGKIIGRAKIGLCRKHQRNLSIAVKRARILSLVPFVVKPR